jgi:hypothetical protein
MNIKRLAYAVGRAIGAAGQEFVTTMWPPKPSPHWVTGEPSQPVYQAQTPTMPDGQPVQLGRDARVEPFDDSMDWFGWAIPAICETLVSHEYVDHPLLPKDSPRGMCHCMTPAHNPIDSIEWVDHAAMIIAEKLACDPARAIAALWNYELRRQETT